MAEYQHEDGHGRLLPQESSMCCSCISSEPTIIEDRVCSSARVPLLEPGLGFKEEYDDEEDVKYWWAALVKNSIMLMFMSVVYFVTVVPGGHNVFVTLRQFIKIFDSAKGVLRICEDVWREGRTLPTSLSFDLREFHCCDLVLLGSAAILAAIIAAAMYFGYTWQKGRKTGKNPVVVEAASEKLEAEVGQMEDDDFVSSTRNWPRSEIQYSLLVQKKQSEENPTEWEASSIPEVKLTLEYTPAEMSTLEKKGTPIQSFITSGDVFQRPERRSRRRSMSSLTNNVVAQELSVNSSAYGRFMANENILVKEVAAEDSVTVTHLRRSSRIRKAAMSRHHRPGDS